MVILMNTHNIHFQDRIVKFPLNVPEYLFSMCFLFLFVFYCANFQGIQEQIRISHDKRAIYVSGIEVLLYMKAHYVAHLLYVWTE